MKNFRKIFLPFTVFPLKTVISAQKRDSIPQKVVAFVTDKFPQSRDFNLEFTQLTPYKYSSSLYGADQPDNKIKSFQQLKANANIYFFKHKKWILNAALNYRYTSMNAENNAFFFAEEKNKGDFHYHSEALSITHISKLFNKIAIYSATTSVDGSEQHFERVRGMLTGALILKADAKTKMTLGVAIFIDPSAQVPALPIFTYEHRFNNGWVADVILPKKIMVRKDVFSNGRISLGTEMDNTSFYLYRLDRRYEFRQLEINSGAIYEHNLGSNFIATLKTGVRVMPRARIFDKEESFKDYTLETTAKPSFYFNGGISYNPFARPRVK
jgi:hypothetical protein